MRLYYVFMVLMTAIFFNLSSPISMVDNPHQGVNQRIVTVYLHGYGESKGTAVHLAQSGMFVGPVISFNFVDGKKGIKHTIFKANFGQLPDVLRALSVINRLKKSGSFDRIDLFGRSRGAAVLINLFAVLAEHDKKYDKDLESIGINAKDRKELLLFLQQGCHVISCPLASIKKTHPFRALLLSIFTQYKKDGLALLDTIIQIQHLKLRLLVHFQRNDTVVGNTYDERIFQTCAYQNPSVYCVYDEGNHNDYPTNLVYALQDFKKLFHVQII